jgi:putative ABC transport system substrate-binding protein
MAGNVHSQNSARNSWAVLACAAAFTSLLITCLLPPSTPTYTIGIINYTPALSLALDGFKAGMVDLGYGEGENITYIYSGVLDPNPEEIDAEIQGMLTQEVDLLFTLGTLPTIRAKQAIEDSHVPVVFAPVIDPVGQGIVESLRSPGGNVTGVQRGNTIPKSLEWLLVLAPGTTHVYVPYHPDDEVSVASITSLREAATALKVELILDEVNSPEEVTSAIQTLTKDTVIFFVPMPSLESSVNDFVEAAIEREIATTSLQPYHLETGVLVINDIDPFSVGKQAARLANQVLQGVTPADLPVETAEIFLGINLKTAQAIDLYIPDEVLEQADTIIR